MHNFEYHVFVLFIQDTAQMISFKYKSQLKQIKIKTKRQLNDRMSPWLQNIFSMKNQIVGFKVPGSKYYDAETFYSHIAKFFGQQVEIIQANDQLEISFVSDNLNSSSFIKPNLNYGGYDNNRGASSDDYSKNEREDEIKIIQDGRAFERKLPQNQELTILFFINPVHKRQIAESVNMMKSMVSFRISWAIKFNQGKSSKQPTYSIYSGKRLIVNLNLTREYKETILMVIERYGERLRKLPEGAERGQQRDAQFFKQSFQQQNQAPSFTTYQLQERLSQQACQDYLARMFRERLLKKYEFLKLAQKCDENFVEFYKIFCQGALDNDYENFKNQILHKVDNNLELLLSNVDEMDISRPISREQHRRQNLKRSVPNIEIVKVQNYFQILDQIKSFLTPYVITEVKNKLLDQNPMVCSFFSDYLSRKISKQELAESLQKSVIDGNGRPASRCLPRSTTRMKEASNPTLPDPDFIPTSSIAPIIVTNKRRNQIIEENQEVEPPIIQKQPAQMIKLMGMGGNGSGKKQQQKNEPKEIPPMFGSSKQQDNFSPIKYMSDIESNYKQAWDRLYSKEELFQPQEYGLLYYYLQTRDDSISNHIQQLQWHEQSSIERLRKFLADRMSQIMKQNFNKYELDLIEEFKDSPNFQCLYQNFKFQSDLNKFLNGLKSEISMLSSRKGSSPRSPPRYIQHESPQQQQLLTKKASDSQLLDNNRSKKTIRKYSDENDEVASPKASSFSHPKTIQYQLHHLEILNNIWTEQFNEMINYVNFTEQKKEEYLKNAFKQKNPSVFVWIHQFIQGSLKVIELGQLKRSLRIHEDQNKYLLRIVPIFNQILKFLVEEGKITTKVRKWCVGEFLQPNMAILGAFEDYIVSKNEQQFIENITMSFQFQNNDMQFYKKYIKRIEDIMKSMSAHDEIGIDIFRLYPKQIQALCQVYYLTGNIDELLESLDAIHSVQKNKRKLKVATLNFTGVNLNPFQYHDGSEVVEKIDRKMKEILDKQVKSFQGIKFSSIDKNYTVANKMSVRFNTDACDGGKLLSKSEYLKRWRECFDANADPQQQNSEQIAKQKAAQLDYYCYISIVASLYNIQWDQNYELLTTEDKNSQKLRQFLQQNFKRPASQTQVKYQMVMEYFMKNEIDILFLQEGGVVNWNEQLVHEYGWIKNKDSVILYRKQKIGNLKPYLQDQFKNQLNINDDSVCFFSDRGYLLLSVHLTSRANNIEQATELFKKLQEIIKLHPMLKIIIGTDANHYLGNNQNNFLNYVPDSEQFVTTIKMRTHLQAQFHKAGIYVSATKDYILSNLPIRDFSVDVITGQKMKEQEILPNNRHPFDHFLVVANI